MYRKSHRICPKCHLLLGESETPFSVDKKTIAEAERRALATGDDDVILRFAELASLGRAGGLHRTCAERVAEALRGRCPADVSLKKLAWQTAASLPLHPRLA